MAQDAPHGGRSIKWGYLAHKNWPDFKYCCRSLSDGSLVGPITEIWQHRLFWLGLRGVLKESLFVGVKADLGEFGRRNCLRPHGLEGYALEDMMMAMKKEIEELKRELTIYKVALSNGMLSSRPKQHAMDVPKPEKFKGTRSMVVVDNFLWEMEQYFRAMGIEDDAIKVNTASIYFTNVVLLWWGRRSMDETRRGNTIRTWEEFQRELKKKFYPQYAEKEARAKLHRLTQGITELTVAIAEVESFVELSPTEDKLVSSEPNGMGNGKKTHGKDEEGHSDDSHSTGSSSGNEKPRDAKKGSNNPRDRRKKIKYFLCQGPHMLRKSLKRSIMSTIQKKDKLKEEAKHLEGNPSRVNLMVLIPKKRNVHWDMKVGTKVLSLIQLVEDVSDGRNINSTKQNARKGPSEKLVKRESDMRPIESTVETSLLDKIVGALSKFLSKKAERLWAIRSQDVRIEGIPIGTSQNWGKLE
ncbi:hypothetical protein J1N35_028804 [Gossypium stocksii]|uniref:Retrotransposon gag domain-containing protein n=1 Tax=Gossypium stocksii TaxID=47602 RepID=A0A9D3ZSS6_9ROSI|nr:hypothetical protein J1N35_028804 [Gossypium stocksii]